MRVAGVRGTLSAGRRGMAAQSGGKGKGKAKEEAPPPPPDEPPVARVKRDKRLDESWKYKRDYLRAVVDSHLEQTANPMVSTVVQKRMYELYKQNTSVWSPDKIARVFGMPRALCRAILDFQKLEEDAFPNGTAGTVFDNSVEEMLEAKFGVMLPSQASKMVLRQERFLPPDFDFVDETEGPLQEYGWRLQAKRREELAPKEELTHEPSEEWERLKHSVEILPPTKPNTHRKFRVVIVDTSKRFRDEERPIIVEEVDTSIRTADWTERRTLMTLHRARRRKLRKSLRGMLSMEVLQDVDKFYLDDATIGIPDFWPNNSKAAPSTFVRLIERLNSLPHWKELKNQKAPVVAPKEGDAAAAGAEGQAPVVEAAATAAEGAENAAQQKS